MTNDRTKVLGDLPRVVELLPAGQFKSFYLPASWGSFDAFHVYEYLDFHDCGDGKNGRNVRRLV